MQKFEKLRENGATLVKGNGFSFVIEGRYTYLEDTERFLDFVNELIHYKESGVEGEPVAHMYPADLKEFAEKETFAHAYSIPVGNANEVSTPLYSEAQYKAVCKQRDEALLELQDLDYELKEAAEKGDCL